MTTPYEYFKQASDRVLLDKHEASKAPKFQRVCAKCDAVQPDNVHVNTPCVVCNCPVVMVVPVERNRGRDMETGFSEEVDRLNKSKPKE